VIAAGAAPAVSAERAARPALNERQAYAIVGVAHLVVLAALSLALRSVTPPPVAEAVAVEIVSDGPAGTPPPAPPPAPAPAPAAKPPPPAPEPQPAPEPVEKQLPPLEKPDPVVPDKPKPAKPVKTPKLVKTRKPPLPLDTDALAAQLDKRLPRAKPLDTAALSKSLDAAVPKVKPLDTAALSKALDAALPRGAPPRAARGTLNTAARSDPRAAAAIAAAIRAQVTPCWNLPVGAATAGKVTTLLRLDINRDGSIAGRPAIVGQTGVTAANADFARAVAETARRAVLRCAPLKLPADQYDQWKAVEINFDPTNL